MENNVEYCECEWCGRLVICRETDGQMLYDRCFAEYKSETNYVKPKFCDKCGQAVKWKE